MQILIADDSDLSVIVLKKILEKLGHEVVTVKDGKAVLALAQKKQLPRLVFLDWMMPLLSGLEVCKEIRSEPGFQNVHIYIISSRSTQADRAQGLAAGANGYFTKPLRAAEIESELAKILPALESQQTG